MIKLNVNLVENLNFFLQLLHRASVLVRGLKIWTVVLEGIQQCFHFQDIRFDLIIHFLNVTISAIYCNLLR